MAKEVVLIPPFIVDEICRYGAAELHVISAIFGGIVAQEAIKARNFLLKKINFF